MDKEHTESWDDRHKKGGEGSAKSYLIGFILSILLTLAAYFLVTEHFLTGWSLNLAISTLALLQATVQLLFFLHLGEERGASWNLFTFIFMLFILVILVGGTLWIMYNLDYLMMNY